MIRNDPTIKIKRGLAIILSFFLALTFIISLSHEASSADAKYLKLSTTYDKNGLHLSRVDVITDTPYYSGDFNKDLVPDKLDYDIMFFKDGAVVKKVTPQLMDRTIVEYTVEIQTADKVEVRSFGIKVLSSMPLSFCNFDGVCEACGGSNCTTQENQLTCSDCPASGEDGYCNVADDNFCDKDCVPGYKYPGDNTTLSSCFEQQLFKATCAEQGGAVCGTGTQCAGETRYIELTDETCCMSGSCIKSSEPTREEALAAETDAVHADESPIDKPLTTSAINPVENPVNNTGNNAGGIGLSGTQTSGTQAIDSSSDENPPAPISHWVMTAIIAACILIIISIIVMLVSKNKSR